MEVIKLIEAGFKQAFSRYPDLHKAWIAISFRIGGQIPNSLLVSSVQRAGELDILIRCMEDEFSADDLAFHYQALFSELWVGHVYEFFRLLKERKFVPDKKDFERLSHDLRLLRIPLEKHEIAADRDLKEPLRMQKNPSKNNTSDIYVYSKDDPKRSHIMPSGISERGSIMWQVIDIKAKQSYWIERQNLSERILAIYHDDIEKTTTK